jgi:hypothetical protein
MNYKDRKKLIDQLVKWEEDYNVIDWKVDDIEVWPPLRRLLFFTICNQDIVVKSAEPGNVVWSIGKLKSKCIGYFGLIHSIIASIKLKFIGSKRYIFSGADSHRCSYKGLSYNKYFDELLDYLESKSQKGLLVEYSALSGLKVYKRRRVISAQDLYLYYYKFKSDTLDFSELGKNESVYKFLNEVESTYNLAPEWIWNKLRSSLSGVMVWSKVYEALLKQTGAKCAFGLCYYNEQMYGMNLAASKLGVKSIDMQHGGQGSLHIAYSFSEKLTRKMALLPDCFWVWDELSRNWLDTWNVNKNHEVVLGGNPWLSKMTSLKPIFDNNTKKKAIALLTLQKGEFFQPYLIETIANTAEDINWWVRFHPRMTNSEKEELTTLWQENGILGRLNIKEANEEPLPLVLLECFVHISAFSGCISEAASMNIMSIITSEIGVDMYQELVLSNQAIPCISSNSNELTNILKNQYNKKIGVNRDIKITDYKKTIDELDAIFD